MQTPVLEPPRILPETVDRRLYRMIHGLPHSTLSDRYVTTLSDLGEGLGWVAAGIAVGWLGGARGRRAGLAMSFAAATATATFYPRVAPLVFALATGVGISRVHLGHHFPSDVVVGGLIGMGCGTVLASVLKTPESI